MKLPKRLEIYHCAACNAELGDSDFPSCGVSLHEQPAGIFFNYSCPNCSNFGRYLIPTKADIGPTVALRQLAELLDFEDASERGTIANELSKLYGVEDFLKLGGKDAPREPSKDDTRDLP